MEREEAIAMLKMLKGQAQKSFGGIYISKALDMAIEVLEQEPVLDKSNEESEGMKRKHGDILDKIRLEMVKSARPIVSEYNKIEDGMSLRKILQIIDYWHETESEG